MEIVEYLKGRWLVALIVAPLLAGVGAGAFVLSNVEPEYQARGRTAVARALAVNTASFSVGSVVGDYRNAIRSEGLAREVAELLDIPIEDVRGRLATSLPGPDVTSVDLSFKAETAELATAGLEAAARIGLEGLSRSQLDLAIEVDENAERRFARESEAMTEFQEEHGVRDVVNEYRQRSQDLLNLRTQMVVAGDPSVAAALQQLFTTKDAERQALGELVDEYSQLQGRLDRANASLDEADASLDAAQARYDSLQDTDIVTSRRVSELPSTPLVAQAVVGAVLGALALALGFALLARRRSRPFSDMPESDMPDSDMPESDMPESDMPESDMPDSDALESDMPESDMPESDMSTRPFPAFTPGVWRAEESPSEESPSEDTLYEDTPYEDSPAQESRSEESRSEESPSEESPSEESLYEGSLYEDSPYEDTPSEESPAQESPYQGRPYEG